MATTRMKVSNSVQVYHRNAAATDMPAYDIGTSDVNAKGMGGSGDFEIDNDTNTAYVISSKVQDASAGAISSGAISKFIYIKHSGYTSATKDTATTALLDIGLGAESGDTVPGFKLEPGESIVLHGLSNDIDNLGNYFLKSSSGNIYVEIRSF